MGIITGWKYCQGITITGNATEDTNNIQLLFHIHRSVGTSSGYHVYVGTDCKEDFSDIRFYDNTSETIYHHAIHDIVEGVAQIWVKFPSLPYQTPIEFFVLYGNPDAVSTHDPQNTFIFYEDFSSGVLNPAVWTTSNITTSIEDGILKCETSTKNVNAELRSIASYPALTAMDVRCKCDIVGDDNVRMSAIGFSDESSINEQYLRHARFQYTPTQTNALGVNKEGGSSTGQYITWLTADTFDLVSIERSLFATDFSKNYNDSSRVGTTLYFTSNPKNIFVRLLTQGNLPTYTLRMYIDYIYVRNLPVVYPLLSEDWTPQLTIKHLSIQALSDDNLTSDIVEFHCTYLYGLSDITVSFGDGTTQSVEDNTSFYFTHQFDIAGTFTVTVSGYDSVTGLFKLAECQITISKPPVSANFSITDGGQWEVWEEWIDYDNDMISLQDVRSIRVVISSDRLLTLPGKVKIKIAGPCKIGDVTDAVLNIEHAAIVARSGATSSGTGVPTPITFNNGSSSVTIGRYANQPENPMYYEVESDWLEFDIEEDTDYLIILDATIYKTGSTYAFVDCPITERDGHITYTSNTASYNTADMVSPSEIEGLICLTMVYGRSIELPVNIVHYTFDQCIPRFEDYYFGLIPDLSTGPTTMYLVFYRPFRSGGNHNIDELWYTHHSVEQFNYIAANYGGINCGEYNSVAEFYAGIPTPELLYTYCYAIIHADHLYTYTGYPNIYNLYTGDFKYLADPLPSGYWGRSFRHVPKAEDQFISGETIRFKLTGSTTDDIYVENMGIAPSKSIGVYEYRGPADYNGTITRITFGGLNSVTIPAGESIYSDWITFSYDKDTIYTIVMDTTSEFPTYLRNVLCCDLPTDNDYSPHGSYYHRIPTYSMNQVINDEFDWWDINNVSFAPNLHAFIEDIQTLSYPEYLNIIQFNDTSTGNPTEWYWNFGDGNHSLKQNPIHTYQSTGTYTVTLTVSNQDMTNTYSTQIYIHTVLSMPHPYCTPIQITSIYPDLPEGVDFINLTTPLESSLYRWDFGNGQISVTDHPHTSYSDYGEYTVKLLATNQLGTRIVTYPNAFKFIQCQFRIINETIRVQDKSHGFVFAIISELIELVDNIMHAAVCEERVSVWNGDDPESPIHDEYGIRHMNRRLNEYGNAVFNRLTAVGRYVIGRLKSKTNTDCEVIPQYAVCDEMVLVETRSDELDLEP
jgi:PKD repeat protein